MSYAMKDKTNGFLENKIEDLYREIKINRKYIE